MQSRYHTRLDTSATGWITMSDVFLMSTVFAISLALVEASVSRSLAAKAREGSNMLLAYQQQKGQITAARQELESLKSQAQADRLRLGKAEEHAASLEAARGALLIDLAASREAVAKATGRLRSAVSTKTGLLNALAASRAALADANSKLTDATAARQQATTDRDVAVRAQAALQLALDRQGELRQELLGLKGSLKRVVFVLDRSVSMGDGDRWNAALKTAATWVDLLPVQEAALVAFSDSVTVYPEDGHTLLNMRDPKGRQQLLRSLDSLRPSGQTNTLLALKTAYAYPDVDAIILFTDGRPTLSPMPATTDSDYIRQAREYVGKQVASGRRTRIHVIGLADYFAPEFGKFLLDLALTTDGSFIGR